ncbi:RUS family member 1 isoform X1 [Coccinella septempunctata]|uniref:RUS family member 1 isoform X1 n=1 Tax=Coccinella septempunctata TaxID=41139 RepID=UPI001D05D595|nr:RUS family member 1 isoform X1 [Coccinella septempunctata]
MKSESLLTETYGTKVIRYQQKNPLRIERIESKPNIGKNLWLTVAGFFKEILLPYGYPDSVSTDYFEYQLWDTLQAFCSTIVGSFTTRAILKGVGVGDAEASALSATITWIMKDGSGMIGRIFFAWWKGNMLDCNCKKWRLFADGLNNIAMLIEIGIPFYSGRSMEILCLTSMMKSIVGIAGGATRASITNHQAKQGNMAEISAKDGTQETVVNLFASFTSLYLLSKISNPLYELPFIFLLMILHFYFNFKAVKCLTFDTLNDSRIVLVLREYFKNNSLNPSFINSKESVILGFGLKVSDICNFKIKLGSSLRRIVKLFNFQEMEQVLQLYKDKPYLVISDVERKCIYVALEKKCEPLEILRSYVHAVMLAVATCFYNNIPLKVQVIRKRNYTNFVARLETFMKSINKNTEHYKNMTPSELKLFNEFVQAEITMFFVTLNVNEWNSNFHSLCMEQWKTNWKHGSKKNE